MSVSLNEIVLMLVVAGAAALLVRRTGRRWIGVVPLIFLTAALFSPADPVSTLMIAVPNVLVLAWGVRLGSQAAPAERT